MQCALMESPGRTLVIETASEACSVALFEGEDCIAHGHQLLGKGHAEHLVPMIKALPGNGRANRILTSLGPGSFTGVRIGIAAARALGVAWGVAVQGYPTLALLAASVTEHEQHPVTVCINGGHGEWFVQDYGLHEPQNEVRSLTPEAAKIRGAHKVIAGNRSEELAALFEEDHQAIDLLPDARMARLLKDAQLSNDLSPIYGRQPDAKPQMPEPARKAKKA